MSDNPKNQLQEYMQLLGCSYDTIQFSSLAPRPGGMNFRAGVEVSFPDGRSLYAEGEATKKTQAELAAAQEALTLLHQEHPDLLIDWETLKIEAQGGDALIKLGVYISPHFTNAEAKSLYLQKFETDAHLAQLFDKWKAQNDPDLAIWGPNLGEKRKATLVEAYIWRRYREYVLNADARSHLEELLEALTP